MASKSPRYNVLIVIFFQLLDELDVQSLYFNSNTSSDASVQSSCSATTVPSQGETLVNTENSDDLNAWLSSLQSKIESDQNATTNDDLENTPRTEFLSNTNSFNYPNFAYTPKGSMVSIRPSLTTYEDLALFKLPIKYYCDYCLKYFWTSEAVKRHKHKINELFRCWKCSRRARTLDELKRHFYFYHDSSVMRFRPALPHF